jgi:hypothetical protein
MPFDGLGHRTLFFFSILFFMAGSVATYLGVADHYTITLIGGPVSILIGIMLMFKGIHKHNLARQRKSEKRNRQFLNSTIK